MILRGRWNVAALLASTALLTTGALTPRAYAASRDGSFMVAQAPPPAAESDKDKKGPPPGKRPPGPPPKTQQPPLGGAAPKAPAPPAAPQVQQPPAAPARPAQSAPPPQPPAASRPAPAPAAQDRREERRDQRRDERRPGAPQAPAAQRPQPPTPPSTAQQPPAPPSTAQQPPAASPPAPAAQDRRDERRDQRRDERRPGQPQAPAAQRPQPPTPPATAQQPAPPSTAQQPPAPPSTAQQPPPHLGGQPPAPGASPAAAGRPNQPPAAAPAAVAPPTQALDSRQFLRRNGQQAAPGISQLRQERQETREGDRTFIREQDRTIIVEGGRTIIRHNEGNRFAVDARDIRTERRGDEFETIIERPNGVRIVNVTDRDGRLIRRLRRDPGGRDVIIIDNGFERRDPGMMFVQLPEPVIRIPRERYILDADRARPGEIYGVFMEPPVERIERRYTLDQVRFSAPLRDRMPRVDLDVTFDTGSWQLTPEQVDRLAAIADGINRAVERNPREVFLVEGHTDAVGNDVDNLSLSDRRAESVAVALSEQFRVPAENLVTQGYGAQYPKVATQEAERANRRVAVRRITPLIDQQASNAPPSPPPPR